jgi:hypothetical protein
LLPQAFSIGTNGIAPYIVSSNGFIEYGDEAWNAAYVLIGRGLGTNSFTATPSWIDCSGGTHDLSPIVFEDTVAGIELPFMIPLATVRDTVAAIENLQNCSSYYSTRYNSGGMRLTINSGNARIYGFSFLGPKKTVIFESNIEKIGAWGLDQNDPFDYVPRMLFSDTVGDYLLIPFFGKGLKVILRRNEAGGMIDAYLDGRPVYTAVDTYYPGGFVQIHLELFPSTAQFDNHLGDAEHVALLRVVGNNAQAVAPSAGKHRATIVRIEALD